MKLSVVFALILDLAEALGVSQINKLGKAWVCPIDKLWIIAINATQQVQKTEIEGTMGCDIPPMHTAVFFNGWFAGLMLPDSGVLCAGAAGNEDNLIAALRARIEKETGRPAKA